MRIALRDRDVFSSFQMACTTHFVQGMSLLYNQVNKGEKRLRNRDVFSSFQMACTTHFVQGMSLLYNQVNKGENCT